MPAGIDDVDFFVSHTSVDEKWAEWIAAALEAAGYTTFLQAWDFAAGAHFVHEMHQAAVRSRRTIAVLSTAYTESAYTEAEWQAAWAADVQGEQRTLLVFRIEDCDRPGLLRQIVSVDLFGVDEESAKRRLLSTAGSRPGERRKPAGPVGFPGSTFPAGRPVRTNLPPRNPAFTGRAALLDDLGHRLEDGTVAVVAVRGLGGVGKSQVALEYAHRARVGGRYALIWWIRAEAGLTVSADLAAMAPALGVPVVPDQTEIVAGVRAALAARDDWLLVLDNATTSADVRQWLPGGDGHVVITSRDRGWGALAQRPVDLERFTRPESLTYLRERLGHDDPDADALANELGDLPLALAQAAGRLDTYGGSVRRYLELYRIGEGAARLLAGEIDGYPHSVATTWLVHFTDLETAHPAALQLLQLCAHLDPDDIALDLILGSAESLSRALTADLAAAATDPVAREAVVGALTRNGLLVRTDDTRVRIHRVLAEVARHQITADGKAAEWADHVVSHLVRLYPQQPWASSTWPISLDLAAHTVAAVEHAEDAGALTRDTGTALTHLASLLRSQGEINRSCAVLEWALRIDEAVNGPNHPDVAGTLGNLGIVQRMVGQSEAARAGHLRALRIFAAVYGPKHAALARELTNLAVAQMWLGEPVAARANLERALAIKEEIFGLSHYEVGRTLANLGGAQARLGDLGAARASQERTLEIFEAAYGLDHPDVVRTLMNLARVQHAQGDGESARANCRRAVLTSAARVGPDHPETREARWLLGELG